MQPSTRAAITAFAVTLIVVIALGVRSLNALGFFSAVVPGFAGTCHAMGGVTGAEDIVIDDKAGVGFVSASDMRARLSGKPSALDGIYVIALNGLAPMRKLEGTPGDFHPHGISLYRAPDGTLTLFAINHRSDGTSSIDSFDVHGQGSEIRLHEIGSIEGGELVSPNAIAALDRDRFYVTNDHTSQTPLGRLLDDWLILPRANVVYFDGAVFRVVATRLNAPSGAVLSPDGRFLYVSETLNRRLDAYARHDFSGDLDPVKTLSITANLDNLRFDTKGNLWVAGHQNTLAMRTFFGDPSKPAPSEVFHVALSEGIPQSATLVFSDLGQRIGGASVAAVIDKRMLIGSPLENKILDCTMQRSN